ncbi:hypothetical protein HNR60_004325 [Rhodopseudomonas rhenobacensis]|uniref:Uncharacterized protein n=1 Tax=Rhodopseudomonas rhenobacensis TaxID=87461 RepID=A0A7W7Z823_9BRAD|nr:hypothetical protein [Rhodopseudomonas rhenobacensis]MBB5049545.1 hypothetical protein [Rhodopseudomonas rhenobacensis]
MTDQKLEFIDGQLKALFNIVVQLINTHPDPAALKSDSVEEEVDEATLVDGQLPAEAFLDGMNDINQKLMLAIEAAIARRGAGSK